MNLTHNAGSINVDDVRRGEGHGVLVNGHRVTAGLPTSLDAWDVVPIGGAANFLFCPPHSTSMDARAPSRQVDAGHADAASVTTPAPSSAGPTTGDQPPTTDDPPGGIVDLNAPPCGSDSLSVSRCDPATAADNFLNDLDHLLVDQRP